MKKNDIVALIRENLKVMGIEVEENGLRVQPDPFVGWRVVVISKGFDGLPLDDRRKIVFHGLENEIIQWADLLTPEESLWAGTLPADVNVEDLPLWPEALARRDDDDEILFPSDLEQDLEPPIIATFYSLRGGVGRSTALAYTARSLARHGHSVLCVDMDLEAPGLAALFGYEDNVESGSGLLSVLLSLDQGETPDLIPHIIRVSNSEELYCLPAGRPDADYARRLRLIDPEAWYREERNPLREFIDLAANLPFRPDVILLDARTGVSPISAPLLFDLSDLAVITFFPHPQALTGTKELVRALVRARSRRFQGAKRLAPEPRFLISPVPPREVDRYRRRAEEWIQDWLKPVNERRDVGLTSFESTDIVHMVPYREVIASSDHILENDEVLRWYDPVANWIERFLPAREEREVASSLSDVKPRLLQELQFSTGSAEAQREFLETFVPTEVFVKAALPNRPLVVGRKGTGKTALFRWLSEGSSDTLVIMCPSPVRPRYKWVPSPDGFKRISETLDTQERVGWREFWILYTALACHQSLVQRGEDVIQPPDPLAPVLEEVLAGQRSSERTYINALAKALTLPGIGLLAAEWLEALDLSSASSRYLLLFDGLDTGFGNSEADRRIRQKALEGLFTFVLDREPSLRHFDFKILIREDIWNKLRFENKSHLHIRAVRLEWRNEADYVRTILKQALRSRLFARLVSSVLKTAQFPSLELWPDEMVFRAWNVLVGERMKGGKTAYTVNWVWNRLADGNGDHSPRALFQLFNEATEWEKQEQSTNPYEKSVIRPRALIMALEKVSQQSVDSLLEEFGELEELIAQLRAIGRSPVDAQQLERSDLVGLAVEVGLLEVYEERDAEVRRYRVPDLYRIAIGMTRKGQL